MTNPNRNTHSRLGNSRLKGFSIASGLLLLCFGIPLFRLLRFSFSDDLYSHVVLIPAISGYFAWMRLKDPLPNAPPQRIWSLLLCLAGMAVLGIYVSQVTFGTGPELVDGIAYTTLLLVLLFGAVCCFFLGGNTVRALMFPLLFLLFMVPFPIFMMVAIDDALQHGSAMVAHWLFELAGTPLYFIDLTFKLPGITLQVAPECSGIHSSLALLISSIVAGFLFLRSPWRRLVLAVAVVPLALLRNGFRIFVVGQLCVHIGPEMIHSYIHKHGGPIFFVVSLVPFFLLLLLLIKTESHEQSAH